MNASERVKRAAAVAEAALASSGVAVEDQSDDVVFTAIIIGAEHMMIEQLSDVPSPVEALTAMHDGFKDLAEAQIQTLEMVESLSRKLANVATLIARELPMAAQMRITEALKTTSEAN